MNPYLPMIIGPFVGLVLGSTGEQIRQSIKTCKERKKLRQRLFEAFRFNLERINQMIGQLQEKGGKVEIPTYPLDTDLISSVMFSGRDLFKSQKEFDDLNLIRFQLVHLNTKLTLIWFSTNSTTNSMAHIPEFRDHLTREKISIGDILGRYEKVA
jgi:hypothetical protein